MTIIESIPIPVMQHMLTFLPVQQLPSLRTVCKLWKEFINDEQFIRQIQSRYFGKSLEFSNKSIWKQIDRNSSWLSNKKKLAMTQEKLPLVHVRHFAKCHEGTIISGTRDIYYKSNSSTIWQRRNFVSELEQVIMDTHRDGYILTYNNDASSCTSLVFGKWENAVARDICSVEDIFRYSTAFKSYNDGLFVCFHSLSDDPFVDSGVLEEWDLNQNQLKATFNQDGERSIRPILKCDGNYLAHAEDAISLWDLRQPNKRMHRFGYLNGYSIQDMDCIGDYFIETRYSTAATANLWDLRSFRFPVMSWTPQPSYASCLVGMQPSTFFLTSSSSQIEFWNVSDLQKKQEFHLSSPDDLTWNKMTRSQAGIYWDGERLEQIMEYYDSSEKAHLLTYTLK